MITKVKPDIVAVAVPPKNSRKHISLFVKKSNKLYL